MNQLSPTGQRMVFGKGPKDSPFVIVGEAPGGEEVKAGAPFIGPSGLVLQAALDQLPKGSYPEPYCTNVSKVRLGSNKTPAMLGKLAQENREALLQEITAHPRKIVLALGGVALMALLGQYDLKITKHRGQFYSGIIGTTGLLAALHPAYLLRGGGSFRQFKSDVAYAMQMAQGKPPHPYVSPTYKAMESPDEVKAFIEKVRALPPGSIVAGDLETSGFSPIGDRILCGGFTVDGLHVDTFWHRKTGVPANWDVLECLKPLWEIKHVKFVWHNGKFDVKFFQAEDAGFQPARVDEDTMLMSYALDETRGIHDLEQVASDWIGSPSWKNILDAHKKKKASYDVIPPDILEKYMAYDIANTFNLVPVMKPLIEADKGSSRLYDKTLIPASTYLADIESHGMMIDPQRVKENAGKIGAEMNGYASQIAKIANERSPGRYTPKLCNSPKQLAELLFDDLMIISKERGTGDDILDKLPQFDANIEKHKVILLLRKYRKVAKQFSTYIKPFLPKDLLNKKAKESMVQKDGRVHCTYLIHGTATGRLSSREPNMQNIPRDNVIKGQFVAPPGRMLIEVDLNQAELRSLACLSGDPDLCEIYLNPTGKGLHEVVRAEIYGYAENWDEKTTQKYLDKWFMTPESRFNPETGEDRILKEQKMRAKNVNFGIIYGITKYGLAEQIDDTPEEAQRMLDAWAKKFPVAWHFINLCRNAPLHGKNIVTVFGHKKRFGIVTEATLNAIQNEAANFPHQSTAAQVTLHGGIRTYEELRAYDSYFVNTVHDSNIIECPLDPIVADTVSNIVKGAMEQVPIDWGITRIPFVAERDFGTRWGSLMSKEKFWEAQNWVL